MVSPTNNPKVLRVQFERHVNEISKYEVVCYLKIMESGVQVYYSHHRMYARAMPKGPWSQPGEMRAALSFTLQGEISAGVFHALWDAATGDRAVEVWPLGIAEPLEADYEI